MVFFLISNKKRGNDLAHRGCSHKWASRSGHNLHDCRDEASTADTDQGGSTEPVDGAAGRDETPLNRFAQKMRATKYRPSNVIN